MTTAEFVSARQAARMIGKNERTIRRWIVADAGKPSPRLPGAYQDDKAEFRVPVAALAPHLPSDALEAPSEQLEASTATDSVDQELSNVAPLTAAWPSSPTWMERAVRAEALLAIVVGFLGFEEDQNPAPQRAWLVRQLTAPRP
jgi:hypothetical protein